MPRLFWLGEGQNALPCIARGPEKDAHTTIVFVPPFAEEMNRCRRWLSLTAAHLEAQNIQTLIFDLPGTGDSPQPFAEATWESWVEATRRAIAWASQNGPLLVAGVRFGALLADAVATDKFRLINIAPMADGSTVVRNFLRAGGPNAQNMLEKTGVAHIAGYVLRKSLADAIAAQKLAGSAPALDVSGHAHPWLQVEPEEPTTLAQSTADQLLSWMRKDA